MTILNTNIASTLTKDERAIISILREVIQTYAPNTILRIAGGWVRDHIMGVGSNDIDVMVNNMSGEDFAKLVTQHLKLNDPHVIRENPEKSKHIETAKAYIPLPSGNTHEIDFARARKEVYTENSRIPITQPATAEEDAMRRDLTINALFYNINSGQLEDFTGKGIKDLISNTIRTPEDPQKTFKDDPLRIFRTIRFATKYNWKIDPATYQAMKDPSLRDEIRQKISKERIGQEIKKMLTYANPSYALELLSDTNLFSDILEEAIKKSKFEGKMMPIHMEQNNPYHTLTVWGHTMEVVSKVLDRYESADEEKRLTMILAALMHDLGKLFTEIHVDKGDRTSYHGHEHESYELARLILRYLKLEPYIQQVAGLSRYHMQLHNLTRNDSPMTAMRKFIRRMGEASLDWLDVFNLTMADAYSKSKEIDPATIEEYNALEHQLQEALASLKPLEDKSIPPVLNGNEIMQILNIKPGAWMKDITEFVKELRDENPDISKEEASEKLKEKFGYLSSTPPQDIQKKSSSIKDPKFGTCPMHLFHNKFSDIRELINKGSYQEALSTLNNLLKDYSDDEKVTRFAAQTTFAVLSKDMTLRDNNILEYLFRKAEKNFFDSGLCSYVVGLLILLDTPTESKEILRIGRRMSTMSPGILKHVLNGLPDQVYHPSLKSKLVTELKS